MLDASDFVEHEHTANSDQQSTPSASPASVGQKALSFLLPHGIAVAASLVAAVATGALWPSNHNTLFAFYYIAVLLSAIYAHLPAATVAVVLSTLTANYFFLAPRFGFAFDAGALYRCTLFVAVSAVLILLVERLKARERKLRASESRLREAQRIARMGSWEWDITSGRMHWSDQLFKVLAIAKDTVPHYDAFIARVHPDDRASVEKEVRIAFAEKAQITSNYRLLLPDGAIKAIHARGAVARDEQGRALRLVGTTHDVTERWQTQEQLRISEERFRSLVGITAAVFWWTDSAGQITEATGSWGAFTGMSAEAMTQLDGWLSAVHPADQARAARAWREATKHGTDYCTEYRLRRNDGVWRDMMVRGVAIRNPDGSIREWIGTCVDVTEAKATDAAAGFRASVLDATGESIIVTDPAGKIIYMNPFAETQWGCSAGTAVGHDIMEVTVPDISRARALEIMDALRRGEQWRGEFLAHRRDGRALPIYASNTPLFNDAGELVAIIGVARDLSERHEFERALRESEERYRAAFEQAAVGICEMSFEGTFQRVNPRLCEVFGYSAGELVKTKFSDITHPDDLPQSLDLVGELAAGQRESFATDKRYVRKDGRVIWAISTVSLLRDRDGKPQSLIAVVEDISARKEAEEKLRFQAHMLDSAGEAILATDADGAVIYVNRQAELLYGWPKEEVLGRSIVDLLLPPATAQRAREQDVMAELRAGQHGTGEYFLKRRDGVTVRVSISVSVVRDEAGGVQALVGISRDVTEINRAREQLVHSEGRLRGLTARLESSREEERTRIARAIHDELGQLLTGLKMDLRWVEDWLERSDDARLRPFLDRIVGSTELTDAMIKAVQGIAADLRPGILDALGLAHALDFEARRFQERTGTPCTVEHPEEMPVLSADVTTSLFRIFQECLTNVARHSAATEVDVTLKPEGDEVILCVADNGRGMRDIERVAVESLGLLGITERVKLLGGNVSFSSAEKRGTMVVVRLPQRSQVAYGAE